MPFNIDTAAWENLNMEKFEKECQRERKQFESQKKQKTFSRTSSQINKLKDLYEGREIDLNTKMIEENQSNKYDFSEISSTK